MKKQYAWKVTDDWHSVFAPNSLFTYYSVGKIIYGFKYYPLFVFRTREDARKWKKSISDDSINILRVHKCEVTGLTDQEPFWICIVPTGTMWADTVKLLN